MFIYCISDYDRRKMDIFPPFCNCVMVFAQGASTENAVVMSCDG